MQEIRDISNAAFIDELTLEAAIELFKSISWTDAAGEAIQPESLTGWPSHISAAGKTFEEECDLLFASTTDSLVNEGVRTSDWGLLHAQEVIKDYVLETDKRRYFKLSTQTGWSRIGDGANSQLEFQFAFEVDFLEDHEEWETQLTFGFANDEMSEEIETSTFDFHSLSPSSYGDYMYAAEY